MLMLNFSHVRAEEQRERMEELDPIFKKVATCVYETQDVARSISKERRHIFLEMQSQKRQEKEHKLSEEKMRNILSEIAKEKREAYEKKKLREKVDSLLWDGEKGEYQLYAWSMFEDYGWDVDDFECLIKLWFRESNWSPSAHNSSSGAHGIAQSLPASKMASEGSDYYDNAETQIRWGIKYIKNRYGSPSEAWDFWLSHNWY